MKTWVLSGALIAVLASGAPKKPLPGQAGNDDIELTATVLLDRDEIHQALGEDLGADYVVVRMKASPKGDKPLRISPDDFTLVSRKNGDRSSSLTPTQIAGKGALVVKSATLSDGQHGLGASPGTARLSAPTSVSVVEDGKPSEGPLLDALKAKMMADRETQEPLEGLLYFTMDGKLKPKDLSLLYKGPAGRLVLDFK